LNLWKLRGPHSAKRLFQVFLRTFISFFGAKGMAVRTIIREGPGVRRMGTARRGSLGGKFLPSTEHSGEGRQNKSAMPGSAEAGCNSGPPEEDDVDPISQAVVPRESSGGKKPKLKRKTQLPKENWEEKIRYARWASNLATKWKPPWGRRQPRQSLEIWKGYIPEKTSKQITLKKTTENWKERKAQKKKRSEDLSGRNPGNSGTRDRTTRERLGSEGKALARRTSKKV